MSESKLMRGLLVVLKVLGCVLVTVLCLFLMVFIPFMTQEVIDLVWNQFNINPDVSGYILIAIILLMAVLDFLMPYLILRLYKLRPKWPWLVLIGVITTFWTLFVFWLGNMVRD